MGTSQEGARGNKEGGGVKGKWAGASTGRNLGKGNVNAITVRGQWEK